MGTIINPATGRPVQKASEASLGSILKAFQTAGARFGAQVGALAIKALHDAQNGSQPTLYWRMAECPAQVRDLVPSDARDRGHVALVSAGVQTPSWVGLDDDPEPSPRAPVHLRTDDGTHVWVW